jgi:hypothetical protein
MTRAGFMTMLLILLLCLGRPAWGQAGTGEAAAERVRAEDQTAFAAARAVTDPEQRVKALMRFAADFPDSALAPRASELALDTDLANFPGRTEEIHALASEQIAAAPEGLERWQAESQMADALASAGEAGADLTDAKIWARQSLAALTEASFRREMTASEARYQLGRLTPRQVHADFVKNRAAFLAAAANVALRTALVEEAARMLQEAYVLDPLSGEVNSLRGQLALQRGQTGEALVDFERAEAAGELQGRWRDEMFRLHAASVGKAVAAGTGPQGEAELESQVDAVYAQMYPAPFALPQRKLPAGGHTVLLELFTGAGCDACVAPDLAMDSLLGTYGRQDLVVLEYDENVPRPDPLSNPGSVSRAIVYGVGDTPEAFLDGDSLPVPGAGRDDVENVVIGFADAIESRAAQAPGVQLALAAQQVGGHITATLQVNGAKGARTEVHFALVQDHMRYSGESGVRFHRMVERAVERGSTERAGKGDEATATGTSMVADFDLRALAVGLRAFLDTYELHNDRYGQVHFVTKDFPLDPAQLAVVAWVENVRTHEVLQSAFAPVAVR